MTSLEKALRDFAQFSAKLKGDEKSEARTFLFHLLAAFGHDANTLPEGSTFEYRVRSPRERTRFADFVWPGRCLIEMRSRGVKLSKHYQRTFGAGAKFGRLACPVSCQERITSLARTALSPRSGIAFYELASAVRPIAGPHLNPRAPQKPACR